MGKPQELLDSDVNRTGDTAATGPRVAGVLVGDICNDPAARTKYGLLFEAVGRRFPLLDVHDASLYGIARFINAFQVFHPNRRRWKERFYKNLPAFRARSRRVASHLQSLGGRADVVLQVGVLFDARWTDDMPPSVIYTDYTAHLSAQKPESGRSPFSPRQEQEWIALERRAFRSAGHICTRGAFVRDSIIREYGIDPERVTAIGGGVNFKQLPEVPERAGRDRPAALFIGKQFYRKGGDRLLHAFARARKAVPKARLLLVTGDPIPDGLPLEGVEVIPATWDRSVIAELYRRADLFVLPSRLETWGDVLLEAMAYGLPCVGVRGEAMGEIIREGRNGIVVPPEDIGALSAALIQLFANPQQRLEWGRAARQRVESHYTWDRVVDRMAPLVETVASTHVKVGKVATSSAQ